MRKQNNLLKAFCLTLTMCSFGLTGCNQVLEDSALVNLDTVIDFKNGQDDQFVSSHGWKNGEPFDVYWNRREVNYKDDEMQLSIAERDGKYFAGEVKSQQYFSYGDYEVTMKPQKKRGTASTFFVYVGPSELDENGNPKPHDEIDIEFLGSDTTKVQFNFFTNGQGGNEKMYNLGFDASKEFHTYGFRWDEHYITWFVDGEPVYRVDDTRKKIPSTPGRIMMKYWSGTKVAEGWMGKYAGPGVDEKTSYLSVKTSSNPIGELKDVHEPPEYYDYDWSQIEAESSLSFVSSDDTHTIVSDNDKHYVTYNNVPGGSYNSVIASVEEQAKDNNFTHLKIKNNSLKPVNARVDLSGTNTNPTENNKAICNVEATRNNEFASTNLEWGGSTFEDIQPQEEIEVVIYYEGNVNSLLVMLDSFTSEDTNSYSGLVEISDIKFARIGELYLPSVEVI